MILVMAMVVGSGDSDDDENGRNIAGYWSCFGK